VKVFLDANVLFAVSNPASSTARLIDLLLENAVAVTCDYALAEAERNVQLKWPGRSVDLEKLLKRIEVIPSSQFPLPVELIAKDRPILCSAIRSQCSHLATGDKRDFGHLYDRVVHGVTVVSLLRLAELLRDR
jgi:predicted nucleic acid-binding protein